MANRELEMSKLKKAFQMLAVQTPQRRICEYLHIGRGVLNKYKSLADSKGITYSDLGSMSNEELRKFVDSSKPEKHPVESQKVLASLIPAYVSELQRNRYMTVQKLHDRYKAEHPDGYGYTTFNQAIKDYRYSHNLTFHNQHIPGEVVQIDFAGDPLWLTDRLTGDKQKVVVLVCVLPYSGLGYAKALPNASMEYFFGGISDALTFYGGVPARAKSDNMKQWVRKHDRYEPVFSTAAVEWGAYYNIELETCRVRHPRDKGPVEGLVKKVYNAVYSELQGKTFYDLDSLNSRIFGLMDEFNSKPGQSGQSRLEIFDKEERPMLNDLPMTPYRFRYRKTVKLCNNYHIQVDRHKYSVPYQYVGQEIAVVWDIESVEVYLTDKLIAIHDRMTGDGYSTKDEHMPNNHIEMIRGNTCNAAYFLERAERIGPKTHYVMERILNTRKHLPHAYNSCHGLLSLGKKYGNNRLERACARVSISPSVSYTMVKNVLEKGLDKAVNEEHVSITPQNDYVRGAGAFNI